MILEVIIVTEWKERRASELQKILSIFQENTIYMAYL